MKAFRGTLIAGTVVGVLGLSIWLMAPEVMSLGEEAVVPLEQSKLVQFEPHELVSVKVERPDGDVITLVESEDGTWSIEGTDFVASRSMVNRLKHQFHQLTPRSVVTEAVEDPDLYGLGSDAIRVTLTLRDGRSISLLAGDPNPSSVSYYVQPLPGGTVYTVQKAAVDYLSMDRSRFRENRFVSLHADEVSRLEIISSIEGAIPHLLFVRTGDQSWRMDLPLQQDAGDEHLRRLLGRASALKAKSFIETEEQSEAHGMDKPRSTWRMDMDSGESLLIEVGAPAEEQNMKDNLAYIRLNGEGTVFLARAGLLEELEREPESYRNREVVPVSAGEVVRVRARLRSEEDEDLAGEQEVRFAAQQWLWADGVPVSGSTPKRVATALSGVAAREFVDDAPESLAPYGLDNPVAKVWLETNEGQIEVWIGDPGEPEVGLEGHTTPRRYFALADRAPVYLVDAKVLRVVHDLIREGNRKDDKDRERNISREGSP